MSHPVALDQCRNFFKKNKKITSIPFYDTAGSVKHVVELICQTRRELRHFRQPRYTEGRSCKAD